MSNKQAPSARRKWMISISIVVLVLIPSGYFGYQSMGVYRALDNLGSSKNELQIGAHQEDESMKPVEWTGTEPVNILLMGGDNHIQYYVYTDFQGFKSLIDAFGGINLDVDKDMNYSDNTEQSGSNADTTGAKAGDGGE